MEASLRAEIVACGRDPNHFIKKYVKIRHPQRGMIPFKMFDYQEELVSDFLVHRFNVILKARQLGISEVTAAYAAWLMLFHRDKNILVMATKADTAKNIIKKINTALKKLPKWLMLANPITDNKLSIELDNGSSVKAIASSDDAGRSEAISLLIIDEAAHIKNLSDLWVGLLPTVQAGGSIIVLSTPNGVGGKFHQLYMEAVEGENEFHPTKLMWWRHPERISDLQDDPGRPGFKTSPWYRNEIKSANMSPREIAQELECSFNASGDTVISGDSLEWLSSGLMDPAERRHWDRNLFIWWKPQKEHRYFVTADVSRGDGKDFSGAHVWESQRMEQVAEYYGKIPPDEFARLLMEIGHEYGDALLVVENNTIGLACLEHLKLAFYPNVYFSRRSDARPGEAVNISWGITDNDLIMGFTTSNRNRPLMIAKLEEYVRNRTIVIRSKRFVEEARTFVWSSGRPEAMRGYNDDLIMSAAIGAWIRDTFLAPTFATADVQQKILSGITMEKNVNTDIQGASKDPRFVQQRTMGVFGPQQSPTQIRLPNGQIADFSWLISRG